MLLAPDAGAYIATLIARQRASTQSMQRRVRGIDEEKTSDEHEHVLHEFRSDESDVDVGHAAGRERSLGPDITHIVRTVRMAEGRNARFGRDTLRRVEHWLRASKP
jgi:hypothetical protein